ncbi:hypothetical protein [Microtetraspora malaysiensis]|uniref:hypothetical protein n=1 Tax=Microtetraspora malaysiensis TaxID=161358 RepID=UPI003D8D72AA
MPASPLTPSSAGGPGSSVTCNAPPQMARDDLLLAFHAADRGTLDDMPAPTGGAAWQLADSAVAGDSYLVKLWWKVAGTAEPSGWDFVQAAGADGAVIILPVRGAAGNTPVTAKTTSGSGTALPTPGITPVGSDDLEVRFAAGVPYPYGSITWTPPSGYTKQTEIMSRTYNAVACATRQLASSTPTTSADFIASGDIAARAGLTVSIASAVLLPPTGLTATPVSATQINLAWGSVAQAIAYDVQRQRWDGTAWTAEQTTRVQATTLADTGLAAATRYRYRVRSVVT